MQKNYFATAFLLLFMPLWALAQQYEYWLDNDYDYRVTGNTASGSLSFEVDVSHLQPGIHYLNVCAYEGSERGAISRSVFYMADIQAKDTAVLTEYWLDSDYESRVISSSGSGFLSSSIDIAGLQSGIHFFNVRSQGHSGSWGAMSRSMFYLSDQSTADAPALTEYWLDNDYANKKTERSNASALTVSEDLSSLQPGIHYLNVRSQGMSGQWGTLSRHMFYLYDMPATEEVSNISYWIDNSYEQRQTVALDNGQAAIVINTALLPIGEHLLCIQGMEANRATGLISSVEFKVGMEDILPWGTEQPWESKCVLTEGCANYTDPAVDANGHNWTELEYDDSAWQTLTGPMANSSDRFEEVNYIWEGDDNCVNLRRTFTMDSIPEGKYQLLMAHDDGVRVYLNGQLVVDDSSVGMSFTYDIPQSAFVVGENILAIYIEEISGEQYLDYCLRYVETTRVQQITLNETAIELAGGKRFTLQATVLPEDVEDKTVMWSVDNDSIATVSQSGVVRALKKGTATVTAASVANPNITANCIITVTSDYEKSDSQMPDVPFEFFYSAADYDEQTHSIPNHPDATLADYNLQLTADLPEFDGEQLTINGNCQGYINKWQQWNTESGAYFYRQGQDNMTIIVKVKPKLDAGSCDFISNRGNGYNYMFRVGDRNSFYLHTADAYDAGHSLVLSTEDEQVLAVRTNGLGNYIQIDNLTTGEKLRYNGVNWGGSNNVFNFFNNMGSEYYHGGFFWAYYSFEYLSDDEVEAVVAAADSSRPKVEPYAVLSDNNTVLTFYYDDQKAVRGGMSVGPFDSAASVSWHNQSGSIKTIVFDESLANCTTLTSTAYWFVDCDQLTTIQGIGNLNTANVTDMTYMFYNCYTLASLDLSGFNTENVTSMNGMFGACYSLTSLDLSSFNTANVTDMGSMFYLCWGLTSLDLSNFNTENVTNMTSMFATCLNLTSVDVTHFNTVNVTSMEGVFTGCSALTSVDVTHFNTSNVTNMRYLFGGCSSLTSLDLSNFNTAKVTEMEYMFNGCSALTTIYADESKWNTALVARSSNMFTDCTALVGGNGTAYDASHTDKEYARIDKEGQPGYLTDKNAPAMAEAYAVLSDNNTVLTFYYDDQKEARGGLRISTDNDPTSTTALVNWSPAAGSITTVVFDDSFAQCQTLTTMRSWFQSCANLTTFRGLQNLHTDGVTDMTYTFYDCSSLRSIDLSGFNTTSLVDMTGMFAGCSALTDINLSAFNTSNVTNMSYLFYGCTSLTNIVWGNSFNTSNVENMYGMFAMCSSLTDIDLSGFSTGKATQMAYMFAYCTGLSTIDVSSFDTSAATDISGMFGYCTNLTSIDVSHFNTANVTQMSGLFSNCHKLLFIDLSNFNTDKVTEMGGPDTDDGMFAGCSSLAAIDVTGFNKSITDDVLEGVDNPNLLIYVSDESVAPSTINNVVVDGVARSIVLTDTEAGNGNFYCPQAFRAEHISYRHYFQQETQPGVSRGWEGIALPFNVQTITHEHHGALHPFGTPEEGYPFWLRQLTPNGIVQAVRMIANRPYIISMPNSQAYHDEYNQSGWVTFAANDVTVPVTTTMVTALADSSIVMIPTMQRVEQATEVYAINRSQPYAGYPEGSIFVSNLREVRPFEAYTEHRSASPAPMFYPIDAWMDDGTGIDEMENELLTIDNAYNLNGQRVKTPRKGVFIVNGRKTVVQ